MLILFVVGVVYGLLKDKDGVVVFVGFVVFEIVIILLLIGVVL